MDKIGKKGNFEEVHFFPVSAPAEDDEDEKDQEREEDEGPHFIFILVDVSKSVLLQNDKLYKSYIKFNCL